MERAVFDLEMRILGVLWTARRGLSVQGVLDGWPEPARPGYTTILKKLQVMESKGFVAHEKTGRSYRYMPLLTRNEVSRQKFGGLLRSLFGGDRLEMVSAFLRDASLGKEEIRRARAVLEDMEEGRDGA